MHDLGGQWTRLLLTVSVRVGAKITIAKLTVLERVVDSF